jgi:hypothetical protein
MGRTLNLIFSTNPRLLRGCITNIVVSLLDDRKRRACTLPAPPQLHSRVIKQFFTVRASLFVTSCFLGAPFGVGGCLNRNEE